MHDLSQILFLLFDSHEFKLWTKIVISLTSFLKLFDQEKKFIFTLIIQKKQLQILRQDENIEYK